MQNIENSHEILLLLLCKKLLTGTEMDYINDINDKILFQPFP